MLPVLVTIAGVPISSFGLMMAVAFLVSLVAIWRIARSYDFNEEKILDLSLLTFFGALIGARVYFVLLNTVIFDDWTKILLINRYPGLSFWGGLLGGMLTLWFFCQRLRISFWQMADFAAVATLIGLVFGSVGCFLGGCEYGIPSNWSLATPVVGLVGKRFPVAIFEAILLLIAFFWLWKSVIRFHFAGKIAALFLIVLGVIKFFLEFYRGDSTQVLGWISMGHLFSLLSITLGTIVFYSQSKRSWKADLIYLARLPVNPTEQKVLLLTFKKGWYNQRVSWALKLSQSFRSLKKVPSFLKRKLHVKSTPEHIS